MKPLTREWLDKAEADLGAIQRLHDAREPLHDIVCFHAQQAAEKYLKAVLQERSVRFGRTHDLTTLLPLFQPAVPDLEAIRDQIKRLSELAVQTRYPGFWASADQAAAAIRTAHEIRRVCRQLLGL